MGERPLLHSTVFRLGVAGARWEERYAVALAELDLKPKHVAVLALLRDDLPNTQQELALALGVAPSFVVALADHLVHAEAIERVRDPHDRRRQQLVLTSSGRDLLSRCEQTIAELDRELEKNLGPQTQALREALDVLLAALGVQTIANQVQRS